MPGYQHQNDVFADLRKHLIDKCKPGSFPYKSQNIGGIHVVMFEAPLTHVERKTHSKYYVDGGFREVIPARNENSAGLGKMAEIGRLSGNDENMEVKIYRCLQFSFRAG